MFYLGCAAFLFNVICPHRRRNDLSATGSQREATVDNAERYFKDTPNGHFPHAPRDVT